jgi:glycosyltransferase involved in cell wall biosynthesis
MTHDPDNSQPIRVLYCILDSRFGGPHRLALSVAEHLRDKGVEMLFLFGQKSEEAWRPAGFESFLCRRIQCYRRRHCLRNFAAFFVSLPVNLLKICRIIRSHKIDVVHVDGVTNLVPALAARLTGRPIVWHYNDHLPPAAQRVLLPLVTALASTVIVQGEGLRQSRTAGRPRLLGKTVVLYSAVDTARFDPSQHGPAERRRIRQELGVPADCTLVGAVGNLNRFKGYAHFLEAAAKIKERVGSARFLVVGRKLDTDPDYWEHLQKMTQQLGLTQDVVYGGFREDIPAVLSALDVFVLPSILESCPLAVLEAMAMGVPVVATDVGAVSEVVIDGQTGYVVPSGDGGALAMPVLTLLEQPKEQVRRMVEAARKRVEAEFGIATMAERQKQIYVSMGRRHRRRT